MIHKLCLISTYCIYLIIHHVFSLRIPFYHHLRTGNSCGVSKHVSSNETKAVPIVPISPNASQLSWVSLSRVAPKCASSDGHQNPHTLSHTKADADVTMALTIWLEFTNWRENLTNRTILCPPIAHRSLMFLFAPIKSRANVTVTWYLWNSVLYQNSPCFCLV